MSIHHTKSNEDLHRAICAMPHAERMAILVCSVIERDGEAVAAVNGLIELIANMTQRYSLTSKLQITENLRGVADNIDDLADKLDQEAQDDELRKVVPLNARAV